MCFFAYNLITKKNFVKASRLEFRFNYKILLLVLLLAIITVFASVNATNLYNYTAGIITSTNKGEPIVNDDKSLAGMAYRNVAQRIMGEEVPFLNLEEETSVVAKVKKFFSNLIGKEK